MLALLAALVGSSSALAGSAGLSVSTRPPLATVVEREGHRIFAAEAGTQTALRVSASRGGVARDVTSSCAFSAASPALVVSATGEISFALVAATTPALVVVACSGVEQAVGFEVRPRD